jgi:Undecaprenyl-phosphate galactose phosphotransferase WbaP
MAEVSTSLPRRHAALGDGFRAWQRYNDFLAARFRKFIVAASLISWDFAAGIAALDLSIILTQAVGLEPANTKHLSVAFLVFFFLCLRLYTGCGPSPYERFRLRALGVAAFVALDFVIGTPDVPPQALLAGALCRAPLLLIFGHYVEAAVRRILIGLDMWGAATAVFGNGESSRKLAHLLVREPAIGLTPIGFIQASSDENLHDGASPLTLVGSSASQEPTVLDAEFILFSSASDLARFASTGAANRSACRYLLVEEAHDIQSLWLRTRMVGGAVGVEIRRDLRVRYNRILKRAIDLSIAIPLALVAAPLVAFLALAIKLVDRGPAFYVQERVGRDGATLRILKLRTMYADADRRLEDCLNRDPQARAEWRQFFKLSRDPRILPIIGNFMRRNSLDELPQLWNIIRGDMSLVGPRPFPAYHMQSFDDEFQKLRVSVPPGLTGMWQVTSRSNGDLQLQREQDLFYIRNWSLWLDVYIIFQTIPAVLSASGAR